MKIGMRLLISFILIIFIATSAHAVSETDKILDAADGLFRAMKDKDYTKIWDSITQKSRTKIVEEVFKAMEKSNGKKYSVEKITEDFNKCEKICKSYWDGYLDNFNPDLALEQSKWDMGKVKKGEAEIIITYKKTEKPAVLKMFKEGGSWHVGLVETFWSRK